MNSTGANTWWTLFPHHTAAHKCTIGWTRGANERDIIGGSPGPLLRSGLVLKSSAVFGAAARETARHHPAGRIAIAAMTMPRAKFVNEGTSVGSRETAAAGSDRPGRTRAAEQIGQILIQASVYQGDGVYLGPSSSRYQPIACGGLRRHNLNATLVL